MGFISFFSSLGVFRILIICIWLRFTHDLFDPMGLSGGGFYGNAVAASFFTPRQISLPTLSKTNILLYATDLSGSFSERSVVELTGCQRLTIRSRVLRNIIGGGKKSHPTRRV